MKTWTKAAICASLSLMMLFTCIGYAALTENVSISGIINADPSEPEGLFISDVKVYSTSGLSSNSVDIVLPTNLSSSFNVTTQNARITYEITVYNKTDMTYWYLGTEASEASDPNGYVGTTNGIIINTTDGTSSNSTPFNTADWVPPHTERTFYATYVFGSRPQGEVSTLINFKFGLHMGSVSDAFLKVLNDTVTDRGYYYLADAFDQNYAENKESTVIGNMGEHEQIFNELFGPALTINVDGEQLPVTIMVERRDVDGKTSTGDTYSGGGKTGCEYTVYITVDDLENTSGKATVYAVSYTRGADGVWYMIGELYEGKCDLETYPGTDDTAFDVPSWRAVAKEYTVIGNLKYKVGQTNGETDEKVTEIDDIMSIFHQTFYNNINNHANSMLTKVCQTIYSYTQNNGKQTEHANTANVAKPGYNELKIAFDRLKPYCILDNGATNVRLSDKARELSRAEIIRMLEDINSAYEYYLAVNS